MSAGRGPHVQAGSMAEMHVPHQADLLQRLEVPIDRRDVQVARELVGRPRPIRPVERLETSRRAVESRRPHERTTAAAASASAASASGTALW